MVGEYHNELEAVVGLLSMSGDQLDNALVDMPERVGDELISLLQAVAQGHVTLRAEAIDRGEETVSAEVGEEAARRRSRRLSERRMSETGVDQIAGTLFRIDTKRTRIAIDVSAEGEDIAVQEASFSLDMLEELRAALSPIRRGRRLGA